MKRVHRGLELLSSCRTCTLLNRRLASLRSSTTTPAKSSIFVTPTIIRFASTATANPSTPDWPDKKNPSPYDILQTTPTAFNSRDLKATYYKLARVYHPDSNTHDAVYDNNGIILSDKIKAERFKMLVAAYYILRDPRKKAVFDRFGIGWAGAEYSSTRPNTSSHTSYRSREPDNDFWNAGTWEDYQEQKRRNDPDFQRQYQSTRWKYLSYVVGIMFAAAVIQIMTIIDRTEAHYREPTGSTSQSLYDLDLVLINYGWGFAKSDRISRFLAHRDNSSLLSHYNPELSKDSDTVSHLSISKNSLNSVASTSEAVNPAQDDSSSDTST